jgi:hypothetical protein
MTNLNNFNLSSGSNILLTDYESSYLHDASSFYNYEKDNVPLIKLFLRTDLLRQFLGYPGDENQPTTLTLSSTADHSIGVYDNWDDIVRRIPQRLTFPLFVEICDYGNLGTLQLDGITTIGDNGALHIKNKLHFFESSGVVETVGNASHSPAGSVPSLTRITSNYAKSYFHNEASSTRVGNLLFDNSNFTASSGRFIFAKRPDTEEETDRIQFALGFTLANASNDFIDCAVYTSANDNSIADYDLNAKQKAGTGDSLETARDVIAAADVVVGNIYGNFCSAVKIRNCYGKIKLDGILVDGAQSDDTSTGLIHSTANGFDIAGSEILLENCGAIRTQKAGIKIQNSTVGVLGSLIAHRIYARNSDGSRTSTIDGAGIDLINSNLEFLDTPLGVTADTNFNKFLVAASRCDVGIRALKSVISGGTRKETGKANGGGTDLTTGILQSFQNTKTGIHFQQSQCNYLGRLDAFNNKNGIVLEDSTINTPQFTVDDNQEKGIELRNSQITYGYRCDEISAQIPDGTKVAYHVSQNGINLYATKGSYIKPYYTGLSSIPDYIGSWGGHENAATYASAMTNHGSNTGTLFDLPSIRISDSSFVELVNACFATSANAPVKGKIAYVSNNSKLALRGTKRSSTVASMIPDSAGDFSVAGLVDSWQSAAFAAVGNSEIEITGPTKVSRFGVPILVEENSIVSFQTPTTDGDFIPETFKYGLTESGNQTKIELHSTRACLIASKNSGIVFKNLGGTVSGEATTNFPRKNTGAFQDSDLSSIWQSVNQDSYIQFYPNPFTSALAASGFFEADGSTPFTRSSRLIASGSASSICAGGMVLRAVGNSYVDVDMTNFLYSVPASSCSGVIYSYLGSGLETYGSEPGPTVSVLSSVGYTNFGAIAAGTDPYTNKPLFDTGGSPGKITISDPALAQHSYNISGYGRYPDPCNDYFTPSAIGTQIQIWNIADTSRIHMSNVRLNFGDPKGICEINGYHGPAGKWANGVALDYFGLYGAATTYNNDNAWRNQGVYRLMLGHRGDLKSMFAVSADHQSNGNITIGRDTGGYPIDQVNAQGYMMFVMDASSVAGSDTFRRIIGLDGGNDISGLSLSAFEDIFGWGIPAPGAGVPATIAPEIAAYLAAKYSTSSTVSISAIPSFSIPPLHMEWQGYMRNFLDETGLHIFSNAKQLSLKKVNGLSVYRSRVDGGGEGRDGHLADSTFGVGVRSLNLFELDKLL